MGKQVSKLLCCISGELDESPNAYDSDVVTHQVQTPKLQTDALNYPSSNEWYECGKTRFPNTQQFTGLIKHILTIEDFGKPLGIVRRKTNRMLDDRSKTTLEKNEINIIDLDGIKITDALKRGVSRESIEWFEMFMDMYDIDIEHFCNTGSEKNIRLHTNKRTNVDGWCKKHNIVFEYHGSFFHGDPDEYKRESVNRLSNVKFEELYTRTRNRDYDILLSGYNLCTIWAYKKKRIVTFFIRR